MMTAVPLLLLAQNSQSVVTSARFVDSLTADERLFEYLTDQTAEDLPRSLALDPATRDLPVAQLDAAEWKAVIETAAPPATLQAWLRDALNATREWSRGAGGLLEGIVVPYGQMRDNIVNDPDQTVLRTLTEAQPVCAPGQQRLADPSSLIPACQPPAEETEAFYQELAAAWQANPDEVWRQLWPGDHGPYSPGVGLHSGDLTLAELIRQESGSDWTETQWGLRFAYWSWTMARAALLIAIVGGMLVALALIALLAARNGAEALRWVGGTLVLVALATVALGLIVWVGGWSAVLFIDSDSAVSAEMQVVLRPAVRAFANGVGLTMLWQAGVMGVAGVLVWLSSLFIRQPRPAVGMPAGARGAQ
jgi:hypothetical protein